MKIPQTPPAITDLLNTITTKRLIELYQLLTDLPSQEEYVHWDKLRRLPEPARLTHKEWWLLIKLSRAESVRRLELADCHGKPFQFSLPEQIVEQLHHIDMGTGGRIGLPDQITNTQIRNRYLVSSLVEEAITSSQLEGAATTREVAKELIRTGRKPQDISEQMILNNYNTMQKIRELKDMTLTPDLVFKLHHLVTEKTLDNKTGAGRFRRTDEAINVSDNYGTVFHSPPDAQQLSQRLAAMCRFANGESPDYFIHPVIRAIILHFWLAYDHPFIDGNGRTARALFYWAMLHYGYWLFEFISISSILRKAPVKYGRSFLYTETDDNDLTYFLTAQMDVIAQAIKELNAYLNRKAEEVRYMELRLQSFDGFNYRQIALIRHAIKHPGQHYTFLSHQNSHHISRQTARTDLLSLASKNILNQRKIGKAYVFVSPTDLSERLLRSQTTPS